MITSQLSSCALRQSMLNEIEKKIKKQKLRLEMQPSDQKLASLVPPQYSRHEEKIQMLTDKINKLVSEAEELGCKGQVGRGRL